MLGNEVLAQMFADLLSRCSLIALMYQSAHRPSTSTKNTSRSSTRSNGATRAPAVRLMEEHLHHVENNLRLDPRAPDLHQVLCPTPEPAPP